MKKRGMGIACMQYSNGGTFFSNPSGVFVKVNYDGSVILITGATDIGQGSSTVLMQMVAEAFSLPVEKVGIVSADTKSTPHDAGSVASRVTYFAGNAIVKACGEILETLKEVAEKELGAPKGSIELKDGNFYLRGYPTLSLSFETTVARCYNKHNTIPLGKGSFNPATILADEKLNLGKPFDVYVYAAQVADVVVDTETGVVDVQKIYAVHDCGVPINPSMAEGQVHGGIHMGFGYGVMEEMRWDDQGTLLNPQFTDYIIPTIQDMPELICELYEKPEPTGPFGAKGIGEPSLLPTAPAIANAIFDAVGVRVPDLPITPEKVLFALKEKEKSETNNSY